MQKFAFRVGHLTAGEQAYECRSRDLAETAREFVDELYESDESHYQIYFVIADGSSMTVFQSGLLSYSQDRLGSIDLEYLPDSRESVYEIVTDFLAGNINWWMDRFQATFEKPAGHVDLFARVKKGSIDFPLHIAAEENDLVEVIALIKAGRDVNGLDNKGRTPLIFAATLGHLRICKYLVAHGADMGVRDDWGNTIKILASEYPELVEFFASLDEK